ncbi:MAG: T9SS type A sorting domain-containing protein [Candidatus Kapaibacterium sp.]
MKSIFYLLLFILLVFAMQYSAYGQVSHLDSFNVVVSSADHDYCNPLFTMQPQGSYESSIRFIYEARSGSTSALAWRNADFWGYSSENFIVNNGYMNINAAVTGDMIVWQSNKNNNWDLYYSLWNGTGWSSPVIIDSTSGNETKPNLYFSSYNVPTYYLAYEKGDDICFKYYRNNIWQGDTNLTGSISNKCFSPVYYGQRVYYLQETSTDFNMLTRQRFGISYPGYQHIWYPIDTIKRPNTIRNIHSSSEFHYEYDTLGTTYSYMILNHASLQYRNVTIGFTGNKTNCAGEMLNIPIDNYPLNDYTPYIIFAFQRRTADSNMIVAQSRADYGMNYIKYFSLEDTSTVSKITVSPPVRNGWTLYKLRAVWEKKINGKIALVETFDSHLITGINNLSSELPDKYSLGQNYPNPFNPNTVIRYQLPVVSDVVIKVYDVQGRKVQTLVNERMQAGTYEVRFDGSGLTSGVYFYRIVTGSFSETRRMVLVK